MMDIAKSETFKNLTILNKALLFLIKLNKTAVQAVPIINQFLTIFFKTEQGNNSGFAKFS